MSPLEITLDFRGMHLFHLKVETGSLILGRNMLYADPRNRETVDLEQGNRNIPKFMWNMLSSLALCKLHDASPPSRNCVCCMKHSWKLYRPWLTKPKQIRSVTSPSPASDLIFRSANLELVRIRQRQPAMTGSSIEQPMVSTF